MSADTCIETHYGEREQPLQATPTEPPYLVEMMLMGDPIELIQEPDDGTS